MNIAPEKTAIKRSKPSRPLLDFLEDYEDQFRLNTWLDYGCGHGADLRHLLLQGVDAYGYDPLQEAFEDKTPLGFRYDVVSCNYVLNVIPDEAERGQAFATVASLLKPGGLLMVTARSHEEVNRAAVAGNWTPYNDGWITSKGTFQVGVSEEWMLDVSMAAFLGFEHSMGGSSYNGAVFRHEEG